MLECLLKIRCYKNKKKIVRAVLNVGRSFQTNWGQRGHQGAVSHSITICLTQFNAYKDIFLNVDLTLRIACCHTILFWLGYKPVTFSLTSLIRSHITTVAPPNTFFLYKIFIVIIRHKHWWSAVAQLLSETTWTKKL